MKGKSTVVGCYAILILIGGIMGYAMANSIASLIASSLISLLLLSGAFFIRKGSSKAYTTVTFIIGCLFAFFGYRFFLAYKFMPGGSMAIISGILCIYLLAQRKQFACKSSP